MPCKWLVPQNKDFVIEVRPGSDLPSLAAARDAIRALSPAERQRRPIRVLVHAGNYELDEPLSFGPEDSGTLTAPIIYQAAPGCRPMISAGRRLTGFTETNVAGLRTWTLTLPEVADRGWNFTALYVNGERRARPRLPESGTFKFREAPNRCGVGEATCFAGDLEPWHNIEDVEVVVLHYWIDSHLRIKSLDTATGRVTFVTAPHRPLDDELHEGTARYSVENVREALNTPGQWYLDRTGGELVYLPRPGEQLDNTIITAPRLERLLEVAGVGSRPVGWSNPGGPRADGGFPPDRPGMRAAVAAATGEVHDLHFVGFDWAHTQYALAPDNPGDAQAAYTVPAALRFTHCRDCSLRLGRLKHLGGYGLEAGEGAHDIEFIANCLDDLGGGGIKLHHGSNFCTVADNRITRGGRTFAAAIGIWIGHSGDNTVVHNHIRDFYYTGISLGWIWGYQPSRARRNRIEFNRIEQIGQGVLSDLGGIYSLGVSPGTRICANLIRDVRCYGYGGNGLYPDEGSSFVLYEDNIVDGVDSGAIAMNYGRDCTFRNNLLLNSRGIQLRWGTPALFRPMILENNVFVWHSGGAVQGNWFTKNALIEFYGNTWWRCDGKVPDFAGHDWSHWQRLGHDLDGRVADPLLADETGTSGALRADSPALANGFRPPLAVNAGPREQILANGATLIDPVELGAFVWSVLAIAGAEDGDHQGLARVTSYPESTPCEFQVQAFFENAGDAAFAGDVSISAGDAASNTHVMLAPGDRVTLTLPLTIAADTETVVVRTESTTPGFHGTVLALMFRPEVRIPRLEPGVMAETLVNRLAESPSIPVYFGTRQLADIRLGIAGDCLLFVAEVTDDPIRLINPVYMGSMIDLFGMSGPRIDMGGQAAKEVGQVFLAPGDGERPARLLTSKMEDVPGCDLHFELREGGYHIAAVIPLAALSLDASAKEFPFKAGVYAHLPEVDGVMRAHTFNELGNTDPHAYGRLVVD